MERSRKLKLRSVEISGFKSFNNVGQTLPLGDINILIGANGSGKSTVVSFFRMLQEMMSYPSGHLQSYVGKQGGASALLHFGPKNTPRIMARLSFENEQYMNSYSFTLAHAASDTLIFTEETVSNRNKNYPEARNIDLQPGLKESGLKTKATEDVSPALKLMHAVLCSCRVYHFHDTSSEAKIRNAGYINNNDFLVNDAGNLSAFLYGLQSNNATKPYYEKIVRHIKQAFPQFDDFYLRPSSRNKDYILLEWKETTHTEYIFGPNQISDGTLRFMALCTLLLQPPDKLPDVIVLDEPELGLHPAAIIELSAMIKSASEHVQIILATQSPALLDEFEPEQVITIERDRGTSASVLKIHGKHELESWLQEFTLSEIWDKNILGGKP